MLSDSRMGNIVDKIKMKIAFDRRQWPDFLVKTGDHRNYCLFR